MPIKRILSVAILFLAVSTVSRASTLKFTFSGVENGTFLLSSTPTPTVVSPTFYAEFDNVSVTNSTFGSPLDFLFFTTFDSGGFADGPDFPGYFGAQVFTGNESAPVFAPGVFLLSSVFGGPPDETLTITATPEPSSFALMLTGLAAGAATVRRKGWLTQPAKSVSP